MPRGYTRVHEACVYMFIIHMCLSSLITAQIYQAMKITSNNSRCTSARQWSITIAIYMLPTDLAHRRQWMLWYSPHHSRWLMVLVCHAADLADKRQQTDALATSDTTPSTRCVQWTFCSVVLNTALPRQGYIQYNSSGIASWSNILR